MVFWLNYMSYHRNKIRQSRHLEECHILRMTFGTAMSYGILYHIVHKPLLKILIWSQTNSCNRFNLVGSPEGLPQFPNFVCELYSQ